MKKITIALIACTAVTCHANAVIGLITCPEWTKEARAVLKEKHELHTAWLFGVLSAENRHATTDFLVGNQPSAMVKWVDNYCAANPLDNSGIAADNLIKTLQARKPN